MAGKPTTETKQIKSELIFIQAGAVAAGTTHPGFATWLAPDDIRLVGFELYTMVRPETGTDSGTIVSRAEVSRVTDIDQPYAIAKVQAQLTCRECTVGANANQCVISQLNDRQSTWYPEGYGIDLQENDPLFFPFYYANSMANNHYTMAWAIVYFVERV